MNTMNKNQSSNRRTFLSRLGLALGATGVAANAVVKEQKPTELLGEPQYMSFKHADGTTGYVPVWK